MWPRAAWVIFVTVATAPFQLALLLAWPVLQLVWADPQTHTHSGQK